MRFRPALLAPAAASLALLLSAGTALAQPAPRPVQNAPTPAAAPRPAAAKPSTAPVQAAPAVQAPIAKGRSLQEVLAAAYTSNAVLLAGRAGLRAFDEQVPQALAGWRPTVVLSTNAGYAPGNLVTKGRQTLNNRDLFGASATVTQPLYRGGRTRASTNKAENTVMAERAKLIGAEQQVFTDTINAFVNAIQNKQLLELQDSNVIVLDRQLQATRERFRVGEITRTDVAQAEAAYAGAQAQRQTAAGNYANARATFERLVGISADNLVPPQPLKLPVKTQVDAQQLAAANNPLVVQRLFENAASKDAVDVAFSGLMPTVSLQGTAFRNDNTSTLGLIQRGAQVQATLQVPIYQGGSEYSAIRQAKQQEQQTRAGVDDARRGSIESAARAWETLTAVSATIDSTRAQIRANEIALDGVQREALLGSRTTLDVLNAEQTLLNSRVTLVQNLGALVTASYAVASSIGRLTARDLALPVNIYDETAYYNAVRNKLWGTGDAATDQPGR